MVKKIFLRTHNSPSEEVFNLLNYRSENSRTIDVKRDGNIIRGHREMIYPGLISMGKKINSNFPDKIYTEFSIREVNDGLYMKNNLPKEYSSYVVGGEKIFIKNNGEIKIYLDYEIIKIEPTSMFDLKNAVYNRAVESLEDYIMTMYESKRRVSFDLPSSEKIDTFSELLEKFDLKDS